MSTWLKDTEAHVSVEPELKNTLQEKKQDLQSAKVSFSNVLFNLFHAYLKIKKKKDLIKTAN